MISFAVTAAAAAAGGHGAGRRRRRRLVPPGRGAGDALGEVPVLLLGEGGRLGLTRNLWIALPKLARKMVKHFNHKFFANFLAGSFSAVSKRFFC